MLTFTTKRTIQGVLIIFISSIFSHKTTIISKSDTSDANQYFAKKPFKLIKFNKIQKSIMEKMFINSVLRVLFEAISQI